MRRVLYSWLLSVGLVAGTLVAADVAPLGTSTANGWPHAVVNGISTVDGRGYWLVYADGTIGAHGNAHFYGDMSSAGLAGPVPGGAMPPGGNGYWLVGTDGGIFGFGQARFYGSMAGRHLNQPMFGIASTRSGKGYWMVAQDGGVFGFGDARFYGSAASLPLNQPITGMTTSPTSKGYRLVTRDGGVFGYGDVPFYGSLPGRRLHVADVVGMAATPTNRGYWIIRSGGQVYAFGDAHSFGNYAASACDPVTGIFSNPKTQGYRVVTAFGSTIPYGTAPGGGGRTGTTRQCATGVPHPATAFGSGVYRVGIDIRPGTYRTGAGHSTCASGPVRGLAQPNRRLGPRERVGDRHDLPERRLVRERQLSAVVEQSVANHQFDDRAIRSGHVHRRRRHRAGCLGHRTEPVLLLRPLARIRRNEPRRHRTRACGADRRLARGEDRADRRRVPHVHAVWHLPQDRLGV